MVREPAHQGGFPVTAFHPGVRVADSPLDRKADRTTGVMIFFPMSRLSPRLQNRRFALAFRPFAFAEPFQEGSSGYCR